MPEGPSLSRTRRLLVLIPAVWAAELKRQKGLSLAQAVRVTGARSAREVEQDVEALQDLSLAPSAPDDLLMLSIEDGRVRADRTLGLVDPPRFSLREGAALLAALQPLLRDGRGPAASARRKLRGALPDFLREDAEALARATDFPTEDPGEWADAIEEAIGQRRELAVDYRAEGTGVASRKVLQPRVVFTKNGHWYLAAWDVAKEEEHLYRLDRIVAVELRESTFAAHRGPPLERYGANGRLYFQSGTERDVRVRFRGVAARLAQERWPESARADADAVVVTARMSPGPYLFGWVLGFGGDATIEAPADVRDAFRAHAGAMRAAYAKPAGTAS